MEHLLPVRDALGQVLLSRGTTDMLSNRSHGIHVITLARGQHTASMEFVWLVKPENESVIWFGVSFMESLLASRGVSADVQPIQLENDGPLVGET